MQNWKCCTQSDPNHETFWETPKYKSRKTVSDGKGFGRGKDESVNIADGPGQYPTRHHTFIRPDRVTTWRMNQREKPRAVNNGASTPDPCVSQPCIVEPTDTRKGL